MANATKILARMRHNPLDWRIEDLKVVAKKFSVEYRQHATSHVVFRHPSGTVLTVPSARPIKPLYVRRFLTLIDKGEAAE